MPTLVNVQKPKVLILDSNATPMTMSNLPLKAAIAACVRHGCYWETAHTSTLSADAKAFSWDLILSPCIDDAANGNYTGFETAIGTFTDTTIPVAVMQVVAPGLNATIQAVTGCGADVAAQTVSCTTFNWQSRALTKMHLYGEAAVVASLNGAATPLFHDGTNAPIWRFDIGAHPTMWQAGYATSLTPAANTNASRPWLCFQWMIDQQPTEAEKTRLRQWIRKSYCLLRLDAFDDANGVTYLTDTQTGYGLLLAGGLREIWSAIVGTGDVDPGSTNATVAAWYASKNENQGGLFRACNHHTDFVDNSGSTGPACTSNGALFDNFTNAETEYERVCDIITALGIKLGSDGYGAGYPNVQNGNDMNNPAAYFCANYGLWPWLEESETYPNGTGAGVETAKVSRKHSSLWNGARTLTSVNDLDAMTYTAQNVALTAGNAYNKAYIYCGSVYIHAQTFPQFNQYIDDYCTQFNAAPDVFRSGPWEDMLVELKKGVPMSITV